MKSTLLTLFFTLIFTTSLVAQDIDLKAGLAYPMQSEKLGLNVGGKLGVASVVDVVAGVNLFLPDKTETGAGELKTNIWMIDLDGHYNFGAGGFTVYPLAGINFTGFRREFNDSESSNTEIGLNLGGGASVEFADKIGAFAEIKYILGDADQGVVSFGLLFGL